MSVVEDFSDIDVDDMLRLRKKKHFFGHAFAYMFELGLPSRTKGHSRYTDSTLLLNNNNNNKKS